jgi:DNA-binding beta-propeller fold protein YncE
MGLDQDGLSAAVDTADGGTDWSHQDAIPGQRAEGVGTLAFAPDGTRVYASSWSSNGTTGTQTTIAYDSASGAAAWTARFVPAGIDAAFPSSLVVAPDGTRVYVAGRLDHRAPVSVEANSSDYLVVAYDT